MIIKNKVKFVRGIFIIIGFILGLNFLIMSSAFSHQEISYKKIPVLSGDTLWDIAMSEKENNDYYKDMDVRDVVYDIKQVNNLTDYNLKINQVLEIPTF